MRLLTPVLLFATFALSAPAQPLPEYQVKAAFLANFPSFIRWPDNLRPDTLCLAGRDPFGPVLEQTLAKTAPTVQLRRLGVGQSFKGCHVLFVPRSESRRLLDSLPAASAAAILTIGETPDFLDAGGLISLTSDNNRVRIDIDLEAVHRSRFQFSSRLLAVAHLVKSPRRSGS